MEHGYLQKRFLRAAGILTAAYLCAVFFGLPLVFSNYYFNITETKHTYYLISSGVYLLLLLFARIVYPPEGGREHGSLRVHPAALALCALFAVSVAGAMISRYPGEAFWGENNRYQGLLTLFVYALVALALSNRTLELRWPERAFVLCAVLVSLLGLMNHFGADPLGFYAHLRELDRARFLSTIGNADFYGAYLVLAFAVTLGFFLRAGSVRTRILSALALACVSFGALVAGSDSAALGLCACALVFPMLLFRDPPAMRALALGWVVFFSCAFVFGLLARALPSKTLLSSFSVFVSHPAVSLPLAAVSILIWFSLRSAGEERLLRLQKPYWIAIAALAVLGAAALLLLNTLWRELPIGSLARYVRFNASWGTDRGKIWAFAARFYGSLPPAQQLFGASSGALFHADAARPLFADASLDTAHNEYLQYLVTNGALGLAGYLAALALAIRAGVRRSASSPAFRGFAVAVIAYAAQAAVNIAQPMTTPIFFLLLGILVSRAPQPPPESADAKSAA